ncbi:hypothetical protein Tco_1476572 [Tanacetum coccineum]
MIVGTSMIKIHMAPFSDEYLYVEIANKAQFWQQQNYYGVDLTALHGTALHGYISQEEDVFEINIPLKFTASVGTRIHGLACWFDVLFNGRLVIKLLFWYFFNFEYHLLICGARVLNKEEYYKTSSCRLDLKEPYYRMSQPQAYSSTQDQQPNQLLQSQDLELSSLGVEGSDFIQQRLNDSGVQIH